ncbi:cytochrome B [Ruegeria sediminis]|uniref:Cytochrome B n=1 Tax=Ruegeria sediminis TaxID=2583820 RepID=A0ABY2X4T0_9RHOB|nr:cytochrome b/b6 domain-containing protein [Ruegeria sediminis]TMV10088.1 cytochrome B [Ruegeria sediminis]
MALMSVGNRYGAVAVTIHWLSALLILVLIGSGFRAASLIDSAAKEAVMLLHVPLGAAILIPTLLRLLWWWLADRKPDSVAGDPAWQRVSAKVVHVLFYVVILGMAASGIGMMVLSGAGGILFGASEAALPDFHDYAPRVPHGLGARLMVTLLILHAGAAFYHHFIKKDGLLRRMWYGGAEG